MDLEAKFDYCLKTLQERRVERGALWYRTQLCKMSETARQVLFRLEAGGSLQDLIDTIAWEKYHLSPSAVLDASETRAAQVEVLTAIREISNVLATDDAEVKDSPPDDVSKLPQGEGRKTHKKMSETTCNQVIAKAGGACSLCGREGTPLEVAHVVPLSKGGTNGLENLHAVCRSCHILLDYRRVDIEVIRETSSRAYQLELAAKQIFLQTGFSVLSGATGPDGGVDLIARATVSDIGPILVIVECKWSRIPLQQADVLAFSQKVTEYDATKGIILTNQAQSERAKRVAHRAGVDIVGLAELPDLCTSIIGVKHGE